MLQTDVSYESIALRGGGILVASCLPACAVRYIDIRKPLYERLTFVLHRVETALDFLSIPSIAPDVRALQLSLQLELWYKRNDGEEPAPELPWHGRASSWWQLRDRLPELQSLSQLDIWLDAASPGERFWVVSDRAQLEFDARLTPFLRVSIPEHQFSRERLPRGSLLTRQGFVGRGTAEYWQDPDIAPDITWWPHYSGEQLYQRLVDYPNHPRPISPSRIFPISYRNFFWAIPLIFLVAITTASWACLKYIVLKAWAFCKWVVLKARNKLRSPIG